MIVSEIARLFYNRAGFKITGYNKNTVFYTFNNKSFVFLPDFSLILNDDYSSNNNNNNNINNNINNNSSNNNNSDNNIDNYDRCPDFTMHPNASLYSNQASIDTFFKNYQPRVSAINLNLTNRCNLNCIYCYAQGGDYARISDDMDFKTFQTFINSLKGRFDNFMPFRFEFFGGEPLLNESVIKKIISWQEQRDKNIFPERIINRISTNLTFLSQSMLETLKKGKFIISISIDGSKETHNLQRPFKDSRPSYSSIIQNLKRLKEYAPELVCVARITAYKKKNTLLKELKELIDLNLFDYCSIYNAAVSKTKLDHNNDFEKNYLEMALDYADLFMPGNIFKGCLELNRYLEHLINGSCAPAHCRAGMGYYTFSPDRTIFPCHRLVGSPEHKVPEDNIKNIDNIDYQWRRTAAKKDICKDCPARFFCAGGCRQENLINTKSLSGVCVPVCRFSNTLLFSALIAYQGLTDTVKERISQNSSMDLFTFCGQPVLKNRRDRVMADNLLFI